MHAALDARARWQLLLLTSLFSTARTVLVRLLALLTCGNIGAPQLRADYRRSRPLPTFKQCVAHSGVRSYDASLTCCAALSRALQLRLVQGIPSYNILQNPICALRVHARPQHAREVDALGGGQMRDPLQSRRTLRSSTAA